MAFSPKIKHIDMTNNSGANTSQTAEALFKLLKISGSIKTLLLGGTNIGQKLSDDFFISLGENKTMEHINLDSSTKLADRTLSLVAKGCAMNKYKNGSLTHLSMISAIQSHASMNHFMEKFYISDHDHELWYGDAKVAKEMKNE